MVRMYEENEVHRCNTCGLTLRVTFTAVPVEPLMCCDVEMEMLGLHETDETISSVSISSEKELSGKAYKKGELYTCAICGIEVVILNDAQTSSELDCCGQGMEKLSD